MSKYYLYCLILITFWGGTFAFAKGEHLVTSAPTRDETAYTQTRPSLAPSPNSGNVNDQHLANLYLQRFQLKEILRQNKPRERPHPDPAQEASILERERMRRVRLLAGLEDEILRIERDRTTPAPASGSYHKPPQSDLYPRFHAAGGAQRAEVMAEFMRTNPTLSDLHSLIFGLKNPDEIREAYKAAISSATSPQQVLRLLAPSLSLRPGPRNWIRLLEEALNESLQHFFALNPTPAELQRLRAILSNSLQHGHGERILENIARGSAPSRANNARPQGPLAQACARAFSRIFNAWRRPIEAR